MAQACPSTTVWVEDGPNGPGCYPAKLYPDAPFATTSTTSSVQDLFDDIPTADQWTDVNGGTSWTR